MQFQRGEVFSGLKIIMLQKFIVKIYSHFFVQYSFIKFYKIHLTELTHCECFHFLMFLIS